MPIYEYQCQSCGRRNEVMQRLSDPPLATCEECGGALRKLISAPAFQFKGSGWYVTDYARKGSDKKDGGDKSKDASVDSGKSSGAGSSSSGSSDSGSSSSGSSDSGGSKKEGTGSTKPERSGKTDG
jgi:putative FmdB family regulatory protein